jgi:hypothetical protein
MTTIFTILSLTNCSSNKESSFSQIEEPTYEERELKTSDFDTYLTLDANSFGVEIDSKNQKYIFIDTQVKVYVKLMYGSMLENSKDVKGTLEKNGYYFWSLDGNLVTGEYLVAEAEYLTGTVKWKI